MNIKILLSMKSFLNYVLFLTLNFAKKRANKMLHNTYEKNVQLAFIYRLAFIIFFSAIFIILNFASIFNFKSNYLGYICVFLFLMTMIAVVFEPFINFKKIENITFENEEIRKNRIILWTIITLVAIRCTLLFISK